MRQVQGRKTEEHNNGKSRRRIRKSPSKIANIKTEQLKNSKKESTQHLKQGENRRRKNT